MIALPWIPTNYTGSKRIC